MQTKKTDNTSLVIAQVRGVLSCILVVVKIITKL